MSRRPPHPFRILALTLCAFAGAGHAVAEIPDFDNRRTIVNDDKLLVFIGRKIAISEFDPSEDDPEEKDGNDIIIHMDSAFKARYRVLKVVHGEFSGETIDFKAYDHYGFPPFAEQDPVMLYVSEYKGALYHEKYQFDIVYPTADGDYAGCGDPYRNVSDVHTIDRRPLQQIDFDPPVVMYISKYLISEEKAEGSSPEEVRKHNAKVKAYFSPPVFEVDGDRAICRMGAYPEELFRIKNETVLRARRISDMCREKFNWGDGRPYTKELAEAYEKCVDQAEAQN